MPDLERWRSAVESGTYEGYVLRVQEAMPETLTGTPTVQLTPAGGGETRALDTSALLSAEGPRVLREQVAAAAP